MDIGEINYYRLKYLNGCSNLDCGNYFFVFCLFVYQELKQIILIRIVYCDFLVYYFNLQKKLILWWGEYVNYVFEC